MGGASGTSAKVEDAIGFTQKHGARVAAHMTAIERRFDTTTTMTLERDDKARYDLFAS